MLLQLAGSEASLPEYAPELAFVVLLALVSFAATYLVVRTLSVAFVRWTVRDARSRLGAVGTTAANAFSVLVALGVATGIAGFGSFGPLFSLLAVAGLTAFAGVAYRVERSLTSGQRS
ncbi:hypothetical protein [Haloprofundus halophilus]|uniref:hypothetical protein n=1 Tax=Haloprofundus halophilus TaxID=2283527 RepID=UPI000E43BFB1|nr:hypothetical protein [Haloprofundus halophilus]